MSEVFKNKKIGRQFLPPGEKRVQRTITISPEAERIVTDEINRENSPHKKNASSFIESRIVSKPKNKKT